MWRTTSILALTAAFLHMLITVTFGQTTRGLVPIDWERHFGGQRLAHTQVAAALSPRRPDLIVCVPSNGGENFHIGPRFQLWRIDKKDGRLVQQIPLPDAVDGKSLRLVVAVRPGIVALDDGGVLLVVMSENDQTLLLRLDEKGKLALVRDLMLPPGVSISKVVRGKRDNFLLIGSHGQAAFAKGIDLEGNETWQNLFERGQVQSFTSAIATEDGGWFLVGWSLPLKGLHDPSFSEVWVLKCDALGRKQSERVFSGWFPTACAEDEGGLAVVYNARGASSGVELKLKLLDSGLRDVWSKSLIALEFAMLPTQIVHLPKKGFVVAGAKPPRFWMAGIDRRGEELWDFHDTRQSLAAVTCLDLIASTEGIFAVTSVLSIENPRNPTSLLGIIKLRP